MSAVIDSSVIVASLLDSGPEGQWAESVIAEAPLAAPELALAEAGNILRRLESSSQIIAVEASIAYATCSGLTWICSHSDRSQSAYGDCAAT